MSRIPIAQGSMLTNPYTGEHTITTWYSDGTFDEHKAPLSPPVRPSLWVGEEVPIWSIKEANGRKIEAEVISVDIQNKKIVIKSK